MKEANLQVMPMTILENLDDAMKLLEEDSIYLFLWFSDNQMKVKHDKWDVLDSGKNRM